MGLFDDFLNIVNDVKSVGSDIGGEFSGLKDDIVASVTDIKDGAQETVDGVKQKVSDSVNVDGLKSSIQDIKIEKK